MKITIHVDKTARMATHLGFVMMIWVIIFGVYRPYRQRVRVLSTPVHDVGW